jgi:hemoglobin-like flavoprotein
VDQATKLTQRAAYLARRVDLQARFARFQIDSTTKANLHQLIPLLTKEIDQIIVRFYNYLEQFSETRDILKGHDIARLRLSQRRHWLRLFSCELDNDYVHSALLIGLAHYHRQVAPQTYLAAYSFFQSELLRTIISRHNSLEAAALSISINKLIMLDVSITLNAYLIDAFAIVTAKIPRKKPEVRQAKAPYTRPEDDDLEFR